MAFQSVFDFDSRQCSKCGSIKPISGFAINNGYRRAHCRDCYNALRKIHYHANRDEKIRIRKALEVRNGYAEKRKAMRSRPDVRAKEKAGRDKYRSRPEVAAALKRKAAMYRAKPDSYIKIIYCAASLRARKRGLPFNLDREWIAERIQRGTCEVTGLKFTFGSAGKFKFNPYAPSVDQIVAGKGYTKDNCRLVLTAINLALSEWGLETYLQIASEAIKHQGLKS